MKKIFKTLVEVPIALIVVAILLISGAVLVVCMTLMKLTYIAGLHLDRLICRYSKYETKRILLEIDDLYYEAIMSLAETLFK